MLKLESLNSAKLLLLGKCILIHGHRYPLAPCWLDKARHAHSRRGWNLCGSPSKGVPHTSHLPGGTFLSVSVVSLLCCPLARHLQPAALAFRGKMAQKQKTKPMIVLEELAVAHCLLQQPSFHTLLPVDKTWGFFPVLSTSYGPQMYQGFL